MKKMTIIALFPLAIAALLAAGCGKSEKKGGPGAVPIPTLTIGHVGHDHHIALGVAALEPGLVEKKCGFRLVEEKPREVYRLMEGDVPLARLLVKKVGGGSRMPTAMSQGKINIGLGGIPAVIFSIDRGNPARILCPLNVDGDMLLVRPDFPAKNWKDFIAAVKNWKGTVKIGYKAPVAVAKLIFMKACEASGIVCAPAGSGKPGQVELVNLQGAGNTIPSLESGSIDGAVINEPYGSMAFHAGAARIVSLLADLPPKGMWRSHPCCCLCATEKVIAEHPRVVRALVGMIAAATDIINGNKKKAAEIAAEWTKNPLEVESMSVPNIVYTTSPGEAYRKGLFRWFDMMRDLGKFKGTLEGLTDEEAFARVHDLSFVKEKR